MLVMVFGVTGILSAASAPNIITYQGRILNSNGVPVSDASLAIVFALYDASTDGTCVWSNSSASCATTTTIAVSLTSGLFTENLGDTDDSYAAIGDSIFSDNATLYLEGEDGGRSSVWRDGSAASMFRRLMAQITTH